MPARVRTGTPCIRASASPVPARVASATRAGSMPASSIRWRSSPSRAWRKNR